MKIAVVGTGYVGLVVGTCFADVGHHVVCVDIDVEKIQQMQKGLLPIYEPHLDHLFQKNIKAGLLTFTTQIEQATQGAQMIFLSVQTPSKEDGLVDLSQLLKAAHDIGKIIKSYTIVVIKSTAPVGTTEEVRKTIAENAKTEFDVVCNPEFLRQGFAVKDFMKPDRVIIGSRSEKAKQVMQELYQPFIESDERIIFMDERSAELTKYAANAFLATKITFINEIANLCEALGADVDMIRKGIGSDARIGKDFLFPGIGFGGSCFPKDALALSKLANGVKYDFQILDAVMQVNHKQKNRIVDKVKAYFDGNVQGKKIALWGLAFKPGTDDVRGAPSLCIIKALLKEGALITAYDPKATENAKKCLGDKIEYATDPYQAVKGSDALLIATEWDVFKEVDLKKVATLMKAKAIFDGRNLYKPNEIKKLGFYYCSIGRGVVKTSNHVYV